MRYIPKITPFLISLFFSTSLAWAQKFAFYKYSDEIFPDLGEINSIFQDSKGYIWFAGERGAVFYDGRRFHRFSVSNGLADNYCYKVFEKTSGEIWICTWKGISIFESATGRLSPAPFRFDSAVRDLILLPDGYLMAGNSRPVFFRDQGEYDITLANRDHPKGVENMVNDLLYDSTRNVIWVATEFLGIFSFNLQDYLKFWEFKDKAKQIEYEKLGAKAFDEKHPGFRSLSTNYRIGEAIKRQNFHLEHFRHYSLSPAPTKWYVKSLCLDKKGNIWALSDEGLYKLEGVQFNLQTKYINLTGTIDYFNLDGNGTIYISGVKGLFIISGNDTLHFSEDNGLASNRIKAVMKDQQGFLWIASEHCVLQKLSNLAVKTCDERNHSNLIENIFAHLKLKDGTILLASPSGMITYRNGGFHPFFFQPPKNDLIRGLALDKNKDLILVTQKNIYLIRGKTTRILAQNPFLMSYNLNFTLDFEGKLWFVSGYEVFTWDGTVLKSHPEISKSIKLTTFLYSSPDSSIFLGTWHGLFRIRNDQIWKYEMTNILYGPRFAPPEYESKVIKTFPEGAISDMVVVCGDVGSDSAFWFGTFGGGVLRLAGDSLRIFDKRDGLIGGRISSLYRDKNGDLYFLSEESLIKVSNASVSSIKIRATNNPQFNRMLILTDKRMLIASSVGLLIIEGDKQILLDQACGLVENRVNDLIDLGDNKFLLIQKCGIAYFDLDNFLKYSPIVRPLVVTEIFSKNKQVAISDTIRLKMGQRDLNLYFALLDFQNEFANQYSWYLEGVEKDFRPFVFRQRAIYERLPYGKFRFHLRAKNSMGETTILEKPLTIFIAPYFYETWYFKLIVVLILFFILHLTVAWRLIAAKKATAELENKVRERTKELEQTLEQLKKSKETEIETTRLRTAQRLAGAIAHEFNQPLQVLLGSTELINIYMSEKIDEKVQRILRLIPPAVDRMSSLVQKLTNLTKVQEVDYPGSDKIIDLHNSSNMKSPPENQK